MMIDIGRMERALEAYGRSFGAFEYFSYFFILTVDPFCSSAPFTSLSLASLLSVSKSISPLSGMQDAFLCPSCPSPGEPAFLASANFNYLFRKLGQRKKLKILSS